MKNDYNDVILQKLNNYVEDVTTQKPFGRLISKRLPQEVERSLHEGERTNKIDAFYSRASEEASRENGATVEGTGDKGQRVEETKKKFLKEWALASGNWHTDLSDFTNDKTPQASGTDSDVYISKEGDTVIKLSKGKPYGKRFRADIDNIALFNYVFPNSAYTILGYGDFGKGFVRILEQPYIDFSSAEPLSEKERVSYMAGIGFKPINKENTAFSNGTIVASDLKRGNIIRDSNGNVRVVDADMKLHTTNLGGEYEYNNVDGDFGRFSFAGRSRQFC